MDQKQQELEVQNRDATRRMLGLVEEANVAGTKTTRNLHRQGEQLDRVEDDLDAIQRGMVQADKELTSMERCCGLCNLPFGKSKKHKTRHESPYLVRTEAPIDLAGTKDYKAKVAAGPSRRDPQIITYTDDAVKNETDKNMQQVNFVVGNLRNMAIDMGTEIETQNVQLERINQKAESNRQQIDDTSQRIRKLLD